MRARLRAAIPFAAIHLAIGGILLSAIAWIIFFFWYPYPFRDITHGTTLFLIMAGVDLVCGPLLTWLLYDPKKERWKWYVDIAMILTIQVAALVYGLHGITTSRPVFLAFEGDRFRVVSAADVDGSQLVQAPAGLDRLSWLGPKLVGVKLLDSSDPSYLDSLKRAIDGDHPAFRPSRWIEYSEVIGSVKVAARGLSSLPEAARASGTIYAIERDAGREASKLGYLPMVQDLVTDWIVVVDRESGYPVAYYHKDGW